MAMCIFNPGRPAPAFSWAVPVWQNSRTGVPETSRGALAQD